MKHKAVLKNEIRSTQQAQRDDSKHAVVEFFLLIGLYTYLALISRALHSKVQAALACQQRLPLLYAALYG